MPSLKGFLEEKIRLLPYFCLSLLFNCRDERDVKLLVKCLSWALFSALRINDDVFAKQILSRNASLQLDVIFQLARDLCVRWGRDEGKRSEILRILAALLELADDCGNYENLKEKIILFSDSGLLEEISNAPEWWIPQGSASFQRCPIF